MRLENQRGMLGAMEGGPVAEVDRYCRVSSGKVSQGCMDYEERDAEYNLEILEELLASPSAGREEGVGVTTMR
jgi:hypothetical protein